MSSIRPAHQVKKPSTYARGRLSRLLMVGLTAIGAVIALALVFGEDLAWRMARPDHAALLAGASIPAEADSAAIVADLGTLETEIPRRIPYFARTVDSAAFAEELRTSVAGPAPAGEAGLLALMRTVVLSGTAGVGTGHTEIPLVQRPLSRGFYPLITYLFDDGLWIVHAHGDASELVGWEILEIGGKETADVLELATPYVAADNASGLRGELPGALSHVVLLAGLGLTSEDGAVSLALRSQEGETREVVLQPVELATLEGLAWGRSVQAPVDRASPADPRPRVRDFWLEHRAEDDLLLVRINRIRNAEDETLAEFGRRVAAEARLHDPARVVIDLRANGGGNNQLVDGFVDALAGDPIVDAHGVLYTLIGRGTFSAAGALATSLERRTRTLFAGEPSGFSPNHHGDAETLRLPETAVIVRVASRYWADGGPYDRRSAIEPDLSVPFESRYHFEGQDPMLEAVRTHRPAARKVAMLEPDRREEVVRSLVGRYRFGPHRVLEIEASDLPPESGMLATLSIRGTGLWAESAVYALPDSPDRFATDIPDVTLVRVPMGKDLSIEWHGVEHSMPRLTPEFRLPIELVRAGLSEPEELGKGIAAFRGLAAEEVMLDSRWEFALNRVGYDLLRAERVEDAVAVFALNAELFPTVANVFDSLGEARLTAGDTARAVAALERALEIDPDLTHSRELLEAIGRSASS